MAQVKVKAKNQVTIPSDICKQLNLRVGDLLEAEVHDDHIVLKPQLVVDRAAAFKAFQKRFNAIHTRNKKFSDEEIDADVRAALEEVRTSGT